MKEEGGERYERACIGSTTWRLANPEAWLLRSAKSRAKKSGLPFTLSDGDISIPATCPVLGIPLKPSPRGRCDTSPSLDRVDNNKGYVPGNIVVVSWRANRLKNDASSSELRKLADFYQTLERVGR